MNDDAFLQAILESPDDEGLGLIYADWLEEHGDPCCEFIRVQCQLAKANPVSDKGSASGGRWCCRPGRRTTRAAPINNATRRPGDNRPDGHPSCAASPQVH
jgi:uncharacterized protein (TIGR02996 family)